MTVHVNSIAAFRDLDVVSRRNAILAAYANGACLTDREIAERLGCTDMNAVRPRITELCQEGRLVEIGYGADRVTGRKVRICAVRT